MTQRGSRPSKRKPAPKKIRRLASESSLAATLRSSYGRHLHAAANASLHRAERGELSFSDFLAVTQTENANGYNDFMSRVHALIDAEWTHDGSTPAQKTKKTKKTKKAKEPEKRIGGRDQWFGHYVKAKAEKLAVGRRCTHLQHGLGTLTAHTLPEDNKQEGLLITVTFDKGLQHDYAAQSWHTLTTFDNEDVNATGHCDGRCTPSGLRSGVGSASTGGGD